MKYMTDIDILVKDLDDLITHVLNTPTKNPRMVSSSFINISFNMQSRPLDEVISSKAQEKYLYTEKKDPLIDIIETPKQIRVIAILPGIKREDVWYDVKNGVLTVEIIQYGQVLKKQISCDVKPGQIFIKSHKMNNSVLEIVFDKI